MTRVENHVHNHTDYHHVDKDGNPVTYQHNHTVHKIQPIPLNKLKTLDHHQHHNDSDGHHHHSGSHEHVDDNPSILSLLPNLDKDVLKEKLRDRYNSTLSMMMDQINGYLDSWFGPQDDGTAARSRQTRDVTQERASTAVGAEQPGEPGEAATVTQPVPHAGEVQEGTTTVPTEQESWMQRIIEIVDHKFGFHRLHNHSSHHDDSRHDSTEHSHHHHRAINSTNKEAHHIRHGDAHHHHNDSKEHHRRLSFSEYFDQTFSSLNVTNYVKIVTRNIFLNVSKYVKLFRVLVHVNYYYIANNSKFHRFMLFY